MAKNGAEFETMMKTKQSGNPEYDFLRSGGRYNGYYESKVKTERIAWKFTAQREAAAQAARELVAKSHTQWHQEKGSDFYTVSRQFYSGANEQFFEPITVVCQISTNNAVLLIGQKNAQLRLSANKLDGTL